MPPNAPEFDADETGLLRLEIGEHFCRVKTADGGLCGAKLGSDQALRNHVEIIHQKSTKKPDKRRCYDNAVLREAEGSCTAAGPTIWWRCADKSLVFYARLLEGHEVPEERIKAEDAPTTKSLTKRKSIVIDLTAEDTNPDINDGKSPMRKKKRPNKPLPSAMPLQNEQDLEYELRKIAVQKKMYATELRELEMQRKFAALKKN